MKPIMFFALLAAAPLSLANAAAADGHHGHGGLGNAPYGQPAPSGMSGHPMMEQMMQMMMQMHAGMMQGDNGPGMGMMGSGPGMGMMGSGAGPMIQSFDTDADGTVMPDELRQGLLSQLEQYDADGDGTLILSEFQDLFLALTRDAMVDRFQHLDADGDGAITHEEMAAPANRMTRPGMGMPGTMPMPGSMPRMDGSGVSQDN